MDEARDTIRQKTTGIVHGGATAGQRPFPHLRTAEERYSVVARTKRAGILLGGVLRGTRTLECARCGWTTDQKSGSERSQLEAHQPGNPRCYLTPLVGFIGEMTKAERSACRSAYGDFNLRWMLAGNPGMWLADLERVRSTM